MSDDAQCTDVQLRYAASCFAFALILVQSDFT